MIDKALVMEKSNFSSSNVFKKNMLNEIETKALELFTEGDHPALAKLRNQLKSIISVNREWTGVGFFTDFNLANRSVDQLDINRLVIDDVHGQLEGLVRGAGLILFIENGLISFLEGYCYGEEWSSELRIKKLYYTKIQEGAVIETGKRDIEKLKHEIDYLSEKNKGSNKKQ